MFFRLIEKHRENKLVLDKRLEDNDRALDLAFSNGMEFITNIRAANDMRLAKRSVNETAFDEGNDIYVLMLHALTHIL